MRESLTTTSLARARRVSRPDPLDQDHRNVEDPDAGPSDPPRFGDLENGRNRSAPPTLRAHVKVDEFIASHDGVISRTQARRCGMSDDQIARKVASGEWIRRAPGVYFVTAWPWTAAARVRIAAEWVRPVGALIGVSAAWWLGLGVVNPHPIVVALPPGNSRSRPSGFSVVHRDLRGDRVQHRGLWVTSRALTVLDAAVALGRGGQAFLDRALQQRTVTLDELRAMQSRHLGRRGSAAAHELLVQAADRAASKAERVMIALLRDAGISGWAVNLAVMLSDGREAVIDIAFEGARFALEVDGWAFHSDPERFIDRRARTRALVADGWVVAEVAWKELEEHPDKVVEQIRRTLAHRLAR
ncbi:type IV toxin-antitoxin system AbiEi family antitoxin domain-containing protein [Actinomycetospora termitidis]|uniref:Type IV toxin-antitoxin system AbiEi family antitoxin domain-containing protein n=1 Tax=Actinomycetospora termitidis TaxID=3053470 RepID=A0ABT7MDJ8_9PSEU|nr:type IV toxin-antitoxin system AbiEi family antitoxin domain-containing protein [Actinomycetospora sp. Odt1-22]MDL5158740.1 type IV toxin-antitoxin system AbiEi family antitoxin domain-containing protein [Actinomycetospora sp. Odt1-22]